MDFCGFGASGPWSARRRVPWPRGVDSTRVHRCTGVDFWPLSGLMRQEGHGEVPPTPRAPNSRRSPDIERSHRIAPLPEIATFGAGTIICVSDRSPSLRCGSSIQSTESLKMGRNRGNATPADLRASLEVATFASLNNRLPGVSMPYAVRLPAPRLEYGRLRTACGKLLYLTRCTVNVGPVDRPQWRSASKTKPSPRAFPEQDRQASWLGMSIAWKAPMTTRMPHYVWRKYLEAGNKDLDKFTVRGTEICSIVIRLR